MNGAIRFDVFVGYDGILPATTWYPVVCEVVNDGPGFDAVFEIRSGHFNQDTRRLALELPTGTLKRFGLPMHVPNVYASPMEARLLDQRGDVRAELQGIPVRGQSHWQIPLAGALSRTAPAFPEIRFRNDLRPFMARLLPQVFPDNPIALKGLETIYLSSERALELKEAQAQALRIWLYGGGHLVVGVEHRTQVQGTEWLERMMPCTLTGSKPVADHRALQDWLVSDRTISGQALSPGLWPRTARSQHAQANRAPHGFSNPYSTLPTDPSFEDKPLQTMSVQPRDGEIVAGTETQPFLITANRGLGRLTVFAFSPELEPFLSWSNRSHFWAKVCDLPPELLGVNPVNPSYIGQGTDGVFAALIETRQVRKLPVGWLLLLLVAYLVVIGPLDRFWLKKIDRQMLTWLTFPAYVVFFSLLIYLIGYKLRAGETEWTELHLVDVVGAGRSVDLYGRSYGSIYSPANARYNFGSSEPFAAVRSEFASSEAGGGAIEQRDNNFVARIPVPVWTSRLLVCDWWRPDITPLQGALETQGSNLILRVENRLDKPCRRLRLARDGNLYDLGDLAAGINRTFALNDFQPQNLSLFVEQQARDFQAALQARQRALGSESWSKIRNPTDAAIAASFVSQAGPAQFHAPPGLDLSPVLERGDAILLAWTEDYSPVANLNQFTPRRSQRNTFWRVLIPARPETAD